MTRRNENFSFCALSPENSDVQTVCHNNTSPHRRHHAHLVFYLPLPLLPLYDLITSANLLQILLAGILIGRTAAAPASTLPLPFPLPTRVRVRDRIKVFIRFPITITIFSGSVLVAGISGRRIKTLRRALVSRFLCSKDHNKHRA